MTSYIALNRDAANHEGITGVKLLWTDIPYGTGKRQSQGEQSYFDSADITKTIETLVSCLNCMDPDGVVAVCCDYRAAPDVAYALKQHWCYRGEVIWEFGLGRPRTTWWPVKHNNILTFTRTEDSGRFDHAAVPRAKRLAPKKGYTDDKPAGSVWELTLSNTDPERVEYPNQKPLKLIEPFVLAHTLPGELVFDPFMGSGTTGVAALKHGRLFVGFDLNPKAVEVAESRLSGVSGG